MNKSKILLRPSVLTLALTLAVVSAPFSSALAAEISACRDIYSAPQIYKDPSGLKLAFETHGNSAANTVVIFLNGIDKDRRQWDQIREGVGEAYPQSLYVQIDLLGQGATAVANHPSGGSIPYQEQIRLLKALIETNGWNRKRVVLVGHSYGGGLAAAFARDVPSVASDIILADPFADNLELFQVGTAPMMSVTKRMYEMMGLKGLYDQQVLAQAATNIAITWPFYSSINETAVTLHDVIALTYGNRDLKMIDAVEHLGKTKMHLIPSQFSEMIPLAALTEIWAHVPKENTGDLVVLPTDHDSIRHMPKEITAEIVKVLKK